jgi:hypothetical protein
MNLHARIHVGKTDKSVRPSTEESDSIYKSCERFSMGKLGSA